MVVTNQILNRIIGFSKNIFEIQRFPIGAWDMDTNTTKQVTWNIGAKYTRIVIIAVMIKDDDALYLAPLDSFDAVGNTPNGGIFYFSDVTIDLKRNAAGSFNSINYNSLLVNRGYITVLYTIV